MDISKFPGAVSTAGMTQAEKEATKKAMMDGFVAKMQKTFTEAQDEEDKKAMEAEEPPLWLVFYDDQGSREDCSVFYCIATPARSRKDAILKANVNFGCKNPLDRLDATLLEIIP